MSKVKVYIEETLCREIEVDCPDYMDNDEAMEYAEDKVLKMYKNEEIVLTADDYNGNTCYMVEDEDGRNTGWNDL